MSEEIQAEEIIIDILTVMKYQDYERIKIRVSEKRAEESFTALELPTRLRNAIKRNNKTPGNKSKNCPRIYTIGDLMHELEQGHLDTWEGIGSRAIADAKHAVIKWHISENIDHGRLPLEGVQLI